MRAGDAGFIEVRACCERSSNWVPGTNICTKLNSEQLGRPMALEANLCTRKTYVVNV